MISDEKSCLCLLVTKRIFYINTFGEESTIVNTRVGHFSGFRNEISGEIFRKIFMFFQDKFQDFNFVNAGFSGPF